MQRTWKHAGPEIPPPSTPHACTIVGLGGSAGALEPLERFFAHVALESGLAYVVMQHLDRQRPSLLAELIGKHTRIPVRQADNGERVEPNRIYVVPPNALLTLEQGQLRVTRPLEANARASIDIFFSSLAQEAGENAVGIILSGNGSDGTVGMRAIKEHGGLTLAQFPSTARHDSMPMSAIAAGLVDVVCAVEDMPQHLLDHHQHRVANATAHAPNLESQFASYRDQICVLLHQRTGHDFHHYKDGTLLRRIKRRALLCHARNAQEYMKRLQEDDHEAELLLKDLLIGVTRFFRDPDAFEALAKMILPRLVESRPADQRFRVWVPGCSSGEEAYSLAMLMCELLDEIHDTRRVQIFATDIDTDMLNRARQGRYPRDIADQLSPQRLQRFFVQERETFQTSPELREMCIFSEHNLIRDPPFSSLDVISCRNVLIYLDADLQRKLVPLFHYALRAGGLLFLGPSEGLATYGELFTAVDKKQRLFARKDMVVRPAVEFPLTRRHANLPAALPTPPGFTPAPPPIISQAFERMLLDRFVPPSAVVNERGDILSSAGQLTRFLPQPAGAPVNNLLDLAQGSLRIELRTALLKTAALRRRVVRDNIPVEWEERATSTRLTVQPLPGVSTDAGLYVVVLEERPTRRDEDDADAAPLHEEQLINHLEDELRTTRADLNSLVEELESANEELKSSNEELISTNEELQSSNEELQTSKEEIQSINDELQQKVEQLAAANSDLQNLFASTHTATLFLDRDLRITRFTPAATVLFQLMDRDVGRPISAFAPRFRGQDLVADAQLVLQDQTPLERQVQAVEGAAWFVVRVLPYRTVNGTVAGVVITFIDITRLKSIEEDLRQAHTRTNSILESIGDAFYSLDREWRFTYVNRKAADLWKMDPDELVGRCIWEIFPQGKQTESFAKMRQALEQNVHLQYDSWSATLDQWLTISLYPTGQGLSVYFRDITEHRKAMETVRQSEELLSSIFYGVEGAITLCQVLDGGHQFRFLRANRAAVEWSGIPPERWVGTRPQDLFPPDEAAAICARYQQAVQEGRSMAYEECFTLPTGRSWAMTTVAPLRGPDGSITRVVATSIDITARKHAEEALYKALSKAEEGDRLLSALLEYLPEGISIADASCNLIRVSKHGKELLGGPQVGKSTAEVAEQWKVYHPDGTTPMAHEHLPLVRAIQRGEVVKDAELVQINARGERLPLLCSAGPLRDHAGRIVGGIVAWRDITDRKRGEEALRLANAQLLEADRHKNEFLAMLSHELRNPLAPIKNSLHILDRTAPGSDQAHRAKAVINRQVGQLVRLVDDLLDLTRITRGKIQIQCKTVELGELLQHVAEDHRSQFTNAGVQLDCRVMTGPLWIHADAARMAQAVGNLLHNGSKFTPRGGYVTLSLEEDGPTRMAVIRVRDTGMGIESRVIGRLFEPFSQADGSLDRGRGGLGLGLALAKGLVEMHGGTIAAHSDGLGHGAEFTIRLPLHHDVTTGSTVHEPRPPQRHRRVLIIEDNTDAAESLREALELDDHTVAVAYDGPEGIHKARTFHPDIVLCDIGLPGMDGYQVARTLRGDPQLAGIRLVALSGYALPEDMQRASDAGFHHHLAKPPSKEKLHQILEWESAKDLVTTAVDR